MVIGKSELRKLPNNHLCDAQEDRDYLIDEKGMLPIALLGPESYHVSNAGSLKDFGLRLAPSHVQA